MTRAWYRKLRQLRQVQEKPSIYYQPLAPIIITMNLRCPGRDDIKHVLSETSLNSTRSTVGRRVEVHSMIADLIGSGSGPVLGFHDTSVDLVPSPVLVRAGV
jgi:hypothetical protein